MNEEQRAAFLISQAAVLNAEVAGMVAENQLRLAKGETPAYDEAAFQSVINSSVCAHNSAISYLIGE